MLVIVALVLALVIKAFAIQAFFIPSASMENTLEIGDRVLINKVVYHLRPIHRGDIIVFDGTGSWDFDNPPSSSNIFSKAVDELEGLVGVTHDSSIYIKRVIGLPGDHVALLQRAGPGHRQRCPAERELLPVPGQRAVHPEVHRHGPGGEPVGHGGPPAGLLRLPGPHGRPRRREPSRRAASSAAPS